MDALANGITFALFWLFVLPLLGAFAYFALFMLVLGGLWILATLLIVGEHIMAFGAPLAPIRHSPEPARNHAKAPRTP